MPNSDQRMAAVTSGWDMGPIRGSALMLVESLTNTGKKAIFETVPLTSEDLADGLKKVSDLYGKLLNDYSLIVGVSFTDTLAPPHR